MKWYDWLICGCCLAVATLCIILSCLYVKQRDKIQELERQVRDMYIIEDCRNFCLPITRPPQSWCYVESLGE